MESMTSGQMSLGAEKANMTALDYIAKGLGSAQMGAVIALATALTLGAGIIFWASKPSFSPVFDQLERQDVVQILEILKADSIPYQIESKTGLVLVPQDQVNNIRMKLVASGVSATGNVGFELLQQEQSLGTSQFMETSRYQHALETELSRTISSMRNIDSARVHLGLPKQSIFIRNRAKATASVMVKLLAGRTLENGQVAAIANLVASGIPYLESSEVTIVDQWGKLFTSGEEGSETGEAQKQFDYTRRLETLYSHRIEEILSPIIGLKNIRTTVTANLDFTINEQTQELFDGDPTQVRSEQSQDQKSGSLGAIGVPGALANQPPAGGTLDANGNPQTADATPVNTSTNTTRNFELDKTIKHTRTETGAIRRLSVAVIVNNTTTTNEDGEASTAPRTPEEIEQFTSLVKEAVGFDEVRGDTVVVINQEFQKPLEIEPLAEIPLWEQPWFWSAVKQVLAGLSVLLLILMVIMPAMKNLKSGGGKAGALEDQTGEGAVDEDGKPISKGLENKAHGSDGVLEAPEKVYGDILNLARAMAEDDPKRVAKLVKAWVGDADE